MRMSGKVLITLAGKWVKAVKEHFPQAEERRGVSRVTTSVKCPYSTPANNAALNRGLEKFM